MIYVLGMYWYVALNWIDTIYFPIWSFVMERGMLKEFLIMFGVLGLTVYGQQRENRIWDEFWMSSKDGTLS